MIISFLDNIDKQMLLFLNSLHNPFFDKFFSLITSTAFWVPLFALFIYFIIYKYRKLAVLVIIIACALVVCTDILSSHLLKPLIARPRPCHDLIIGNLVHVVNGKCGGSYGFVSSHASNIVGLATFLFLVLKNYYKYMFLGFVWALIICYSRIYLGVHYPFDVICGATLGILCAFCFYKLFLRVVPYFKN